MHLRLAMKGYKEKSTPMSKQGKRKSSSDDVSCSSSTCYPTRRVKRDVTVIESPAWLPKGWITELKTRVTGSSAGTYDKYYYDPVTNKRFPSKTKVFEFLEGANFTGFHTKRRTDDLNSKTSIQERTDIRPVGRGTESTFHNFRASYDTSAIDANKNPNKVTWVLNDTEESIQERTNIRPGGRRTEATFQNFSAFQDTSGTDANKKPNKVLWVLNGTEESWVPLVNNEETNGSDRKEETFIPDGNSVDLCFQEQWENVFENSNPSKGLVKETQPKIEQNESNEDPPIVSPFEDPWPDPFVEFDHNILRGAFPTFDGDSPLWDAFQSYILPQADG